MAINDLIIDSDYPMDLVVWSAEGTISSFDSGGYGQVNINHSLGYAPLCFGVWSLDGGSTWQPLGGINVRANEVFAGTISASSYVRVYVQMNSARTNVRYRVFGLQPANTSGATNPPDFHVSDFILNSDYNYSKLVAAITWNFTSTSSTVLYNHNLGYIPEVACWDELNDGTVSDHINSVSTAAGDSAVWATTSQVLVSCNSVGNRSKLHVRIYGGRNG